jgi:hypothetical protein
VKSNAGAVNAPVALGWLPTNDYSLDDTVKPNFFDISTAGTDGDNLGDMYFKVTFDSGSSGATEPAWPIGVGDTIVDGGITWTCLAEPGGICPNEGAGWEIDRAGPAVQGWVDNTVYAATQDIMVMAEGTGNDAIDVDGYADYKAAPTTVRTRHGQLSAATAGQGGICMAVKRGENWKVDLIPAGTLTYTITVVPWQ